jgi:hypothetical protein
MTMYDLWRDWRRWSLVERVTALAVIGFLIALMFVLALSRAAL